MPETKDKIQDKDLAQSRFNRLGTAKISSLMAEFAIPAIIGLVVNGLYNIISQIFLGHAVGTTGLTVARVAMPIMVFSMAVAMLIGAGGNALIALRLGEGKTKDAERIMGNAFILTIIAGFVCTAVLLIFEDPILRISGALPQVWDDAKVFVRIISIGFVFTFFGMGFNNFIRTAGDPNRALYSMVAGTITCISCSYLFVMVLNWGVVGAASATVLGQVLTAALVFWYFTVSKRAPFKIKLQNLKLQFALVKLICLLGSAAFVLQIAMAVVNALINMQLRTLGADSPYTADGALAAIGVVQSIAMFSFFPIMGVATAAQPIIGYNYGSNNNERVVGTIRVALIWVVSFGVFFWLLVHIIPEQIISMFGIREDLRDFTINVLVVQMLMMPVMGLQVLAANYFQSSGQPLKSMVISLTRQILYLIPLMYIMPHVIGFFSPSLIPLDGLYYAFPVADALSVITAGLFLYFEVRKLKRGIKIPQAEV